MDLSDLLKPEAIKVLASVTSKKRLLQSIGDLFESCYGIQSDTVLTALMEREALGPTGVGHGVALPHARLEGLTSVVGAFVLVEKPVEFESVDRQPVDIAFALLAPVDAGVEHLKALALVSRTLRNTSLCNKVRRNPDAATLAAILSETTSVQAA